MPGREDEAVTVWPVGALGVVTQEFGEDGVGHRRQRHRGARMSGLRLLDSVHGEGADGVYREFSDVFGLEVQGLPLCLFSKLRQRPKVSARDGLVASIYHPGVEAATTHQGLCAVTLRFLGRGSRKVVGAVPVLQGVMYGHVERA